MFPFSDASVHHRTFPYVNAGLIAVSVLVFLYDMTEDPDSEAALTRSWNRWLAETWGTSGGRLPWSCLVPTRLLDEAVVQMRCARAHGAVAFCLIPLEGDRLVTDPYFHPLPEEA